MNIKYGVALDMKRKRKLKNKIKLMQNLSGSRTSFRFANSLYSVVSIRVYSFRGKLKMIGSRSILSMFPICVSVKLRK